MKLSIALEENSDDDFGRNRALKFIQESFPEFLEKTRFTGIVKELLSSTDPAKYLIGLQAGKLLDGSFSFVEPTEHLWGNFTLMVNFSNNRTLYPSLKLYNLFSRMRKC
jgi:hypothetical protein